MVSVVGAVDVVSLFFIYVFCSFALKSVRIRYSFCYLLLVLLSCSDLALGVNDNFGTSNLCEALR